jgi:hypothetical protein
MMRPIYYLRLDERRLRRIGGASGAATQIKVQDVMGEPWGKLQY